MFSFYKQKRIVNLSDKGYLRDTQKVIKGNLPPVCEYNNVMELKKKNVTHENNEVIIKVKYSNF